MPASSVFRMISTGEARLFCILLTRRSHCLSKDSTPLNRTMQPAARASRRFSSSKKKSFVTNATQALNHPSR